MGVYVKGEGISVHRGSLSKGFLSQVVSVHSCFVQGVSGGLCPGGFCLDGLSTWVFVQGVSGGVCPGKGVSVQGVSVQVRGSLSRGGVSNRWVL